MFNRPMPSETLANAVRVPGLDYYRVKAPVAATAPAPVTCPAQEALERLFGYYAT